MTSIEHLSYSSLSTYQSCARSWRFKYLDQQPAPSTPALAFGSAWHATVEEIIRSTALHHSADIRGIWTENLAIATASVPADRYELGESPESLADDGLRMLYDPEVIRSLSTLRPLMIDGAPVIERKVELRVPGVPVPIVGYIDCVLDDGCPVDFKTSERAWSNDRAFNEIQPLFYLAALLQEDVRPAANYRFTHVVFPKSGKARVQIFQHTHTPAQLFWLFGLIRDCWTGIDSGVFHPNPTSWLCSPKFCNYWTQCRGKR